MSLIVNQQRYLKIRRPCYDSIEIMPISKFVKVSSYDAIGLEIQDEIQ